VRLQRDAAAQAAAMRRWLSAETFVRGRHHVGQGPHQLMRVAYHSEGFQSATSLFAFAIWSGVILLATLSRYWIA
jgi:hypothetical protein